jgi:alpha-methylacyl-CoA racemase
MSMAFLRGVRVIDLSQYIPGPYASLMLADLGADVLKVEPPAGDPMRRYGPIGPSGVSAFYTVLNGGKRILPLDLKNAGERQTALSLIGAADVLVESYRPGVMERLGLGHEILRKENPTLVHCAISNFGQEGPFAGKGGHDLNCMALGGGLIASGTAERPVMSAPPVADFASALQAAASVAAALYASRNSGRGAFIDLSMTDTVLAWQSCFLTDSLRRSDLPMRASREDGGGTAFYNIYRTSEGRFLTLAADEDKFWANFCRAVGREDWIARKTEPMPQSALIAEVERLIATRSLADWRGLLDGVDCCFQPVLEPQEVLAHPQLAARGVLARSDRDGPILEALYPAWVDGRAPDPRPPYRDIEAAEALAMWRERPQGIQRERV